VLHLIEPGEPLRSERMCMSPEWFPFFIRLALFLTAELLIYLLL
jgi:hypothetical protein